MDWMVTSMTAINKASQQEHRAGKLGGNLLGTQEIYTVQSASDSEKVRVIGVVRVPGQPIQFTCTCRTEYGTIQPPAGWLSCWHMGSVARELSKEIELDARKGFVEGSK